MIEFNYVPQVSYEFRNPRFAFGSGLRKTIRSFYKDENGLFSFGVPNKFDKPGGITNCDTLDVATGRNLRPVHNGTVIHVSRRMPSQNTVHLWQPTSSAASGPSR